MYEPLKKVFLSHGIPHAEEQHPRGPVLSIRVNTASGEELAKLHRKIEAALKEAEAPEPVAAPAPQEAPRSWWKSLLGIPEGKREAATPTKPLPDDETAKAIKDSMRGGKELTNRERVRLKLERLARRTLPDYDVQVAPKSITQGGYIVAASRKLNGY